MERGQVVFVDKIKKNINQICNMEEVKECLIKYFKGRKEENFFSVFNDKKTLYLLEGYLGNLFPIGIGFLKTPSDYFYKLEEEYMDIFDEINALNVLINDLNEVLIFDDINEGVYISWGLVNVYALPYVANDFEEEEYLRYKDQMSIQEFIFRVVESDVSNFTADEKREFTFSFAAFNMFYNNNASGNLHGVFYEMDRITAIMPDLLHDPKLEKRKNSNAYTDSGLHNLKIVLNRVDKLEGILFEKFLGEIYENMGYQIEYTPTTGDQGIDIICRKNGQRIGVQAKRFSKNVSNSAVQEALGGKIFYQLDEVYVVTNSAFTKSARDLADRTNINLVDREGLKKLIKENM